MSRILIVEDEPDQARSLQLILDEKGHETEIAKSVDTALKSLKKNKPDLILLDIIMPVKLGSELLKTIANDRELKKIPVIVVTIVSPVVGVEEDMRKIKKDIGFVNKPFTRDQLLKEIAAKLK
jgi:DNA-binding NtrC family response regulator